MERRRRRPALTPMPTMRLKLLVLGEPRAGKTSLLKRHRWQQASSIAALQGSCEEDKFDGNYSPTIGVEFIAMDFAPSQIPPQLRTVEGKNVRVISTFMDLAGDIAFLKVRTEFYRIDDYEGALLVFDLASRLSFERLEFWLKEAAKFRLDERETADDIPWQRALAGKRFVVVGNKSDLKSQRVVTEREARQWARDRGFEYWETSAKTGAGVSKAIETLIIGCSATPQAAAMNTAASGGGSRMPSTPRGSHAGGSGNAVDGSSINSGGGGDKNVALDEWSVKDLRAELRSMGVAHDDCLEKKDFVDRVAHARMQQSAIVAAERKQRDSDKQRERIMMEVDEWNRRLDLRGMINDLLGSAPPSPDYLSTASTFVMVSKAYKRALLVVHPDKTDATDWQLHLRNTERFKAVNAAFTTYKQQHDARNASGTGSVTSATAAKR